MSATEDRLNSIREIQGVTGPNYCLASSKFLCGKLIGLYGEKKRLNDMFASLWGRKNNRSALCSAWGMFRGMKDFNDRVLPASLRPECNVRAPVLPTDRPIEFVKYGHSALSANSLLKSGVPVVAGVDLPGGYQRDHFITLVMDRNNSIWAIDSWEASTYASAVELPRDTDLTKPVTVAMNAGPTTIPCPAPWFGYFREKGSQRGLPVTVGV
jgi:hypothetical protein